MPATRPAASAAGQSAESMPLRRGGSTSAGKSPGISSSGGFGFFRVLGALAIVIGAILVLRWGSRWFLGLQIPAGSAPAIRVLARQVVAPRQQLMLIKVGRRILLVANTGAQMNALCEVTDTEEVDQLMAETKQPAAAPAGKPFWSVFKRAESQFEQRESGASVASQDKIEPELATTREEVNGLLGKVKAISRSFRKA